MAKQKKKPGPTQAASARLDALIAELAAETLGASSNEDDYSKHERDIRKGINAVVGSEMIPLDGYDVPDTVERETAKSLLSRSAEPEDPGVGAFFSKDLARRIRALMSTPFHELDGSESEVVFSFDLNGSADLILYHGAVQECLHDLGFKKTSWSSLSEIYRYGHSDVLEVKSLISDNEAGKVSYTFRRGYYAGGGLSEPKIIWNLSDAALRNRLKDIDTRIAALFDASGLDGNLRDVFATSVKMLLEDPALVLAMAENSAGPHSNINQPSSFDHVERYADRRQDEDAIEFYNRTWGSEKGTFYRDDIEVHDPDLIPAISQRCRNLNRVLIEDAPRHRLEDIIPGPRPASGKLAERREKERLRKARQRQRSPD